MKSLAIAASFALILGASGAQAAKYQATLAGGAKLTGSYCEESGSCEPSPRLPTNARFTASFTFDDTDIVWDTGGFLWQYDGPIANFAIQLGAHSLNFLKPNPTMIWASTDPGYAPDGVLSIDGMVRPSWSDQTIYAWYDGYWAFSFEPYSLAVNGPASSYSTTLWVGPDYYELNLEHLVISPIPEPATWTIIIAGFGLAGIALRTARGRLRAQAIPLLAP